MLTDIKLPLRFTIQSIGLNRLMLLFIVLTACTQTYRPVGTRVIHHEINKSVVQDQQLDGRLKPYRARLDSSMNLVLALSSKEMTKQAGENLLGNFCTDLLLEYANKQLNASADFALLTNGGLRVPIPKGPVTVGTVFELMPFDNQVVALSVKGQVLLQLAEMQSRLKVVNIAGARTILKSDGQVITKRSGEPIEPQKTYRIVTIDYLADGGDQMQCLASPLERKPLNMMLRDLFINGIRAIGQSNGQLDAQLDGRIKVQTP